MKKIELLDCTLRDGGYINNFEFGYLNIKKIVLNLINSKIDFIECGFLKNCLYDKNKSIFDKIETFETLINFALPKKNNYIIDSKKQINYSNTKQNAKTFDNSLTNFQNDFNSNFNLIKNSKNQNILLFYKLKNPSS